MITKIGTSEERKHALIQLLNDNAGNTEALNNSLSDSTIQATQHKKNIIQLRLLSDRKTEQN